MSWRAGYTVGASTIPGSYLLPQIMGAFKSKHPSVQLTLKIANTAAVAEMVQKGEAGLGLVGSDPGKAAVF